MNAKDSEYLKNLNELTLFKTTSVLCYDNIV